MKDIFKFILLFLLCSQVAYAGDFVIGTIKNSRIKEKDIPLEICYDANYDDFYPSRIFEIDHREDKFVVYNLYVVYLDSCSIPKLKSVQVMIPKEFKGVCCHVSSMELIYTFQARGREIQVSVPATEKDTLSKYVDSVLFSYPLNELSRRFKYTYPHDVELKENSYMGVMQNRFYTIYYYNFNRKQKAKFGEILLKMI